MKTLPFSLEVVMATPELFKVVADLQTKDLLKMQAALQSISVRSEGQTKALRCILDEMKARRNAVAIAGGDQLLAKLNIK